MPNRKKLKHIIQIFDNSYEYTKQLKSYEDRKEQFAWRDQITSYSGEFLQSELRIPKSRFNPAKINTCDSIFLVDYNASSVRDILFRFGLLDPFQIHCLQEASEGEKSRMIRKAEETIPFLFYANLKSSFKWKSFKFKMEDSPVLYLDYDYFELGTPSRDNFKMGNLYKDVAIEVNINGKRDFSLTGRRERTYHETNIILTYLGAATVVESEEDSFTKNIPTSRKRINLLKKLY